MIDDWEENLAMITAKKTKDVELVLIHLGDCLWKETSNVSSIIPLSNKKIKNKKEYSCLVMRL